MKDKGKLSIFVLVTLMFLISVVACNVSANSDPVSDGLNYLRSKQTNDGKISGYTVSTWVVKAIVAAGEDPDNWKTGAGNPSIVDYLKDNVNQIPVLCAANVPNGYSTTIMALIDAGEDPTNIGGVNLVNELKNYYTSNQIGDSSLVNDDFWGVLALIAAGEPKNSTIIQNTVTFIKNNQQADGGWGYDAAASWGTDPDDTGAAIMALIAAGEPASSAVITNALAYLKNNQGSNGGFLSWGSENSDSTAWAVQAIIAAGRTPTDSDWTKNGYTPKDFLEGLQNADGSFNWTASSPGFMPEQTTAMVIVALKGMPYPLTTTTIENVEQSYTEEQLQSLTDAQTMLATEGTIEDAYSLLKSKGIFGSDVPPIPKDSQVYEDLIKQYGEGLEGFPTFEGRLQLLQAMGIENIEIEMPKQVTPPPPPPANPELIIAEAEATLQSTGNVEEAYTLLTQTGIISEEIPPIPKDSPIYQSIIEIYGSQLERYSSTEGRIQLLKAMGIEILD